MQPAHQVLSGVQGQSKQTTSKLPCKSILTGLVAKVEMLHLDLYDMKILVVVQNMIWPLPDLVMQFAKCSNKPSISSVIPTLQSIAHGMTWPALDLGTRYTWLKGINVK